MTLELAGKCTHVLEVYLLPFLLEAKHCQLKQSNFFIVKSKSSKQKFIITESNNYRREIYKSLQFIKPLTNTVKHHRIISRKVEVTLSHFSLEVKKRMKINLQEIHIDLRTNRNNSEYMISIASAC